MLQHFQMAYAPTGDLRVMVRDRTMDFPNVTRERMQAAESLYFGGALIQDAFDFLTDDQREFLMTGMLPGEWDSLFGEPDPDLYQHHALNP